MLIRWGATSTMMCLTASDQLLQASKYTLLHSHSALCHCSHTSSAFDFQTKLAGSHYAISFSSLVFLKQNMTLNRH